jgi:hypothetical protein
MPIKRRSPLAILAVPVVAAVVLTGVWVTGGAWFALSGLTCLLVARRWRRLRIPVIAAFVLTAGATSAYLGITTLRDRVVDEQVITAAPAQPRPAGRTERSTRERPAGPMQLAQGRFRSHEHATAGTARIIRAPDGRRFLTLTGFATSPGPDLRIRLVPGDSFDGGAEGAVDLGGLKGNRGDQQYDIPRGAETAGRTVVIWCRAFSAPFGSALLGRHVA